MLSEKHEGVQIRNSVYYLSATVVGTAVSLFTLPVFTRVFGPEQYGVLALALVYATFASGIANMGLNSAYERNYFQYENDSKKSSALLFSIVLFVILAHGIVIYFTILFQESISQLMTGTSHQGSLIVWSLGATCLATIKTYFLTYFKNREDAKTYVFFSIDEIILATAFSLFFVFGMHADIRGILWGQISAGLLVLSVIVWRVLRTLSVTFAWSVLWESLKISLPLAPRTLLGIFGSQFDKYLVGLLASVGGVGIYSIGQRIAGLTFTFMNSIQNVFAPRVYKIMFASQREGGGEIGKYLTPFFYLSTFVALCIALFAQEILRALTTPAFYGARDIIVILSFYYAVLFFGKHPQLMFAKKTFISSILWIVNTGITVYLMTYFIQSFGVLGAAVGLLVGGGIVGTGIFFLVSQKYYPIHWEYSKILSFLGIFVAASVFAMLTHFFLFYYPLQLIGKVLFLTLYIATGFLLGMPITQGLRHLRALIPHTS